jgi:uncharacterized protein YjiS (DUF1127 family)
MMNTITSPRIATCKQRRRTIPSPAADLLEALAEPRHRRAALGLSHLCDAILKDIGLSRMELVAAAKA